jgi:drug/metabolite transporter (DMT)-like permease
LLVLYLAVRGEKIPWEPRHQPFFMAVGLLTFTISYGVVYWAEQYIPSGLAAVIFALFPLLTAVGARFWIRDEKVHRRTVAGLVTAFLGITLINLDDLSLLHPRAPLAALVMLASPVVVAAAGIMAKRRIQDFAPAAMAGIPMIYGGIAHALVWRLVERDVPIRWSTPGVLATLYLTVFGSMITFGIYYRLLRSVGVVRLSLTAYLTPLIALVVGFWLGGERMGALSMAGSALVLSGVAVAGRR